MRSTLLTLLPGLALWAATACNPEPVPDDRPVPEVAGAGQPNAPDPVGAADDAPDDAEGDPIFLRFQEDGEGNARLETAVVRFEDAQGRRVDLIGAVHIADGDYYRTLNRLFQSYEAVLYELVAPKGTRPEPGRSSGSWIGVAQTFMKDVLGLTFQLDEVDYRAENLVHADLDGATFARLQEEQNESILGLMLRAMFEGQDEESIQQQSANQMAMMLAAFSKDRAYSLKYLVGQQFGELERMAAGFESGPDGQPSVLIGRRNEACMTVLDEQLDEGRTRLGIFYGAAHLPDFEKRLVERGFHRVRDTWIRAWDIRRSREGS